MDGDSAADAASTPSQEQQQGSSSATGTTMTSTEHKFHQSHFESIEMIRSKYAEQLAHLKQAVEDERMTILDTKQASTERSSESGNAHENNAQVNSGRTDNSTETANNGDGDASSPIPPSPLSSQSPTFDIILYRYLRAYKFHVEKSERALRAHIQYRAANQLDEISRRIVSESIQQPQYPHAETMVKLWPHVVLHGVDKFGQPLSIERLGHSHPQPLVTTFTKEQLLEYHLYHMEDKFSLLNELSIKQNCVLRGCKILDLSNLSRKHMDLSAFSYLKMIIHVSQDNYPETMGTLFIINAPWVFTMCWSMVKPMLNEVTLEKIHILGKDYTETLQKYIPIENIPKEFGGTCSCADKGKESCVPVYDKIN